METLDVQSVVIAKLAIHTSRDTAPTNLSGEHRLAELELDSLALLETLYDLEDHYSITLDSSESHKLVTVKDLAKAVNNALASAA